MEGRGGGKLIALIGDEDTCTGFLLGGIGEVNAKKKANFLVVDKDTSVTTIEDTFNDFVRRTDVVVILINQHIAEMIRHVLDRYDQASPAILEIPSKDHPYDPTKDSILRRAKTESANTTAKIVSDNSCVRIFDESVNLERNHSWEPMVGIPSCDCTHDSLSQRYRQGFSTKKSSSCKTGPYTIGYHSKGCGQSPKNSIVITIFMELTAQKGKATGEKFYEYGYN